MTQTLRGNTMPVLHRSTGTSLAAFLLALGLPSLALAQADIEPPEPNVLLLVDSSGSMEYKTEVPRPAKPNYPTCVAGTPNPAGERSRWINLVEVLTGTIKDYSCQRVARNSNAFLQEFKLGGTQPPIDYIDAASAEYYHRAISGTCTPTPGSVDPTNAYAFLSDGIKLGRYTDVTQACGLTFDDVQVKDGLIDNFDQAIRFGLMTFDPKTDARTGVAGKIANYGEGVAGAWSYFFPNYATGNPLDCAVASPWEVGARNAAAPPWEGRMVSFGSPAVLHGAALRAHNTDIQKILLATRPYGSTPIAGMLDDARSFFWLDNSDDNVDPSIKFGPKDDPYVTAGCRRNYVILLTDGEPNNDLRPDCAKAVTAGHTAGKCPYQTPADIAHDLNLNPPNANLQVKTFVIGFAVSQVKVGGVDFDCKNLTDAQCASEPTNRDLQACCNMNKIALEGGTEKAYFADRPEDLRSALSDVFSKVASSTASRTLPVFSQATGSAAGSAAFRFFSSFLPTAGNGGLWTGVLQRQRYVCEKDTGTGTFLPQLKTISAADGDDFVANVNSQSGLARKFYTVEADADIATGLVQSERSIRPQLSVDDGSGLRSGALRTGGVNSFAAAVSPAALKMPTNDCVSSGLTDSQCRDRYLTWLVGGRNTEGVSRCVSTTSGGTTTLSKCNLVGDIFHSTPAVANRPFESIRDQTYQQFMSTWKTRPTMLYASTNDGLLHAFKVAPNDATDTFTVKALGNNELWAFIPPAVLPLVPSEYPNVHSILLDGAPVLRDVPAYTDSGSGKTMFERRLDDFAGSSASWRSILVQGFGGARGGYFALDVTDPVTGPKFLWQVTTDSAGGALFGTSGTTPAITTLYLKPDVNSSAREVAVAILPGGDGQAPGTATSCARSGNWTTKVDSTFGVRSNLPCYLGSAVAGRSLTIVRLDNGQIIRTFRRASSEVAAALSSKVRVVNIDSPITGQPVAYPGWAGAIADRVFVGDRDGTLWRVDLSSTNPDNWSMDLFHDAFWGETSAFTGQPISTPPVVSTDDVGAVVVAFSTGDQEKLNAVSAMKNYVYSATENLVPPATFGGTWTYTTKVNWFYEFQGGERVAGPLTLFAKGLYFSTFSPNSSSGASVCSSGDSRVFGMQYAQLDSSASTSTSGANSGLSRGGKAWLPENGSATATTKVQYYSQTSTLLANKGIIFGVSVAQVPSCTDPSGALVNDPVFGTASHSPLSSVTPASYQLVMQVGKSASAGSVGVSALTIGLPAPDSSPRLDSWAAVLE